MRDPLCPRFSVEILGKRWSFVSNMRAWFEYEARTGKPVGRNGDARSLRVLLWALLRAEHPDITQAEIGRWAPASIGLATQTVAVCLRSGMPDEKPEQLEPEEGGVVRDPDAPTDWHYLWSSARYDLRLSDEEFWSLHPLQFYALQQRFRESVDRAFHGHCITAAMIYNSSIDPEKSEPVSPMELMPTLTGAIARRKPQPTAEEVTVGLLDKIRGMAAAMR
jgi:hypothetical protein